MRTLGCLLIATTLGMFAIAQAQPGQGERPEGRQGMGRGMRMGPGMSADADWMLLCFELKVSMETLEKLRPTFQKAYDGRRELFEDMRNGELEREELMEEMSAIQKDLDAAYGTFLTADERSALEAAREQRRSSAGGRGRR